MGLFGLSKDAKAYSDAALDDIYEEIPFLNGIMGDIPAKETARVRCLIAEKREWVQGLSDGRWRRAYKEWLDYAETKCAEADKERAKRPAMEARWKEMDRERFAEQEAVADLLKTNPPS